MNSASRGSDKTRLAVGVYDEPELIVSGVDEMLTRTGPQVDVRPPAHMPGAERGPYDCGEPMR